MMTTKFRKSFFLFLILFLGSFFMAQSASAAAKLNLSPASSTVNKDSQFDINLTIDVEQNQTVGSDAVITYPVADLDLVSTSNGGFFTNFSAPANTTTGRIELHGFFGTTFQSKSGSGTFAKITFKAKKDSGSGSLAFICTGSGNDTQILNTDGQNILTCSNTSGSSLSYSSASGGDGGGSNPTPTPGGGGGGTTPKPTAIPTKKPTPRPTLKPSATPQVSPTPQIIELISATPTPEPEPSLFPEEKEKPNNNLLLIGGGAAILVLIVIGIILFKKLSEGANEEPPYQGPISPQPPPTLGQQIPPIPPYEQPQPQNQAPPANLPQNPQNTQY